VRRSSEAGVLRGLILAAVVVLVVSGGVLLWRGGGVAWWLLWGALALSAAALWYRHYVVTRCVPAAAGPTEPPLSSAETPRSPLPSRPPGRRWLGAGPSASSPRDPDDDPGPPVRATASLPDDEPLLAPGSAPTAEPARRTLRRTPHLDLSSPPPFAPGDRFQVEVYADRGAFRAGEGGEEVVIAAPAAQPRFDLQVWLTASADHFAVEEPVLQPLTIRRDEDESSRATFTVRVRETSPAPASPSLAEPFLSALFSYQGRACGRVTRFVPLVPSAAATTRNVAASEPATAPLAAAPPPPVVPTRGAAGEVPAVAPAAAVRVEPGVAADLVVRVASVDAEGRRFSCHVRTPLLPEYGDGKVGPWELPQRTDQWMQSKMANFTARGLSPFVRRVALKGAGEVLFDAAPQVFRDAYWQLADAGATVSSLSIVSDEAYVPWELMIPTRTLADGTSDERPALGVAHAVSRWTVREHVHPPQAIPLRDSFVVAPGDSRLVHAEDEVKLVLEGFDGERVDPASIESLDGFLARQHRSLLHFICHGKREDGEQILLMENKEKLYAYFLRGMEGVEDFVHQGRPLVFLNACEVGSQDRDLVGVGGFAETFMALGAGGVVAALWSVKDELAHQVAKEFYARVKAAPETPYAAILADLRRRSYDAADGEDTWAAYCFYGDPLAAATSPAAPEA
jgi:hypothetical protein